MIILRRAASTAFFRKSVVFDIYLDHRATADAALLVLGLAGIGYLWRVFLDTPLFSLWNLLLLLLNALMLWIVRAGVCLLVGKVFFRIDSSMATIMRLQGFCYLPLALTFLPGSIGLIGIIWFLALLIWQAAVTIAVSVVGLFLISPLLWGGYRLF